MSNLGIRYVLPYQGTNGLTVTNNQIGLDPSGVGEIGALEINKNGSQSSAAPVGASGSVFAIWNNGLGNFSLEIDDLISMLPILTVDISGNLINGSEVAGGAPKAFITTDILNTFSQILAKAGSVNNSAVQIVSGVGNNDVNIVGTRSAITAAKTAGAVVLDATHYVPIEINGTTYKLLIST